jgi:hypothetical protein
MQGEALARPGDRAAYSRYFRSLLRTHNTRPSRNSRNEARPPHKPHGRRRRTYQSKKVVVRGSNQRAHVRFGSITDIEVSLRNVRFTPESGHWLSPVECPLCGQWRTLAHSRPRPFLNFCMPQFRPFDRHFRQSSTRCRPSGAALPIYCVAEVHAAFLTKGVAAQTICPQLRTLWHPIS